MTFSLDFSLFYPWILSCAGFDCVHLVLRDVLQIHLFKGALESQGAEFLWGRGNKKGSLTAS